MGKKFGSKNEEKNMLYRHKCLTCGTDFESNRSSAKYCSNRCRILQYNIQHGKINVKSIDADGIAVIETKKYRKNHKKKFVEKEILKIKVKSSNFSLLTEPTDKDFLNTFLNGISQIENRYKVKFNVNKYTECISIEKTIKVCIKKLFDSLIISDSKYTLQFTIYIYE